MLKKNKSHVLLRGLYMFFYFLVFFLLVAAISSACLPYIYAPLISSAVKISVRQPCGPFSDIFYVLNVFSPVTFVLAMILSFFTTEFTIKLYGRMSEYSS